MSLLRWPQGRQASLSLLLPLLPLPRQLVPLRAKTGNATSPAAGRPMNITGTSNEHHWVCGPLNASNGQQPLRSRPHSREEPISSRAYTLSFLRETWKCGGVKNVKCMFIEV